MTMRHKTRHVAIATNKPRRTRHLEAPLRGAQRLFRFVTRPANFEALTLGKEVIGHA